MICGRIKVYYDIWAIPQTIDIADRGLDAAIRATFERRPTAISTRRPPRLSEEMFGDAAKQQQWQAYAASLELANVRLERVIESVWVQGGTSRVLTCMDHDIGKLANAMIYVDNPVYAQ